MKKSLSLGRVSLGPGQLGKLLSVVFAFIAMFVGNVIAARHFSRWDMTESGRYSLSAPTLETLRELPGPIEVWVLMGPGDPLEQSVKQLLVAYRAQTNKLDVKYIDPDRDQLQWEDVRHRFHIEAGRSEDGRLVADAVIVVAKDDKHWFVTSSDLFDVSGQEGRAKPREEQAITLAIRNVLGGKKSVLCFTIGHGEMSLEDGSDRGLGAVRDVLEKDNYVTRAVDTTAAPDSPGAHEPFKDCDVAIVPGPRGPFKKEEAELLRTYALGGGNLLVASSPITGETPTGMLPLGLERVLEPFGVVAEDALVIEHDPARIIEGEGIGFYAAVRPHAITTGLLPDPESHATLPRVKIKFARALSHAKGDGAGTALDLLASSDKAFAVRDVSGAANWNGPPEKKANDIGGPVILAMASERAKLAPSAPHGPRAVVIGSASFLVGGNWREPLADRGAALFLDSTISWLSAKPQVLDVPEKESVAAGVRLDEASVSEVRRYVLLYMPLAVMALGLTVAYFRRAGDRRPKKGAGKGDAKGDEKDDATSDTQKLKKKKVAPRTAAEKDASAKKKETGE